LHWWRKRFRLRILNLSRFRDGDVI